MLDINIVLDTIPTAFGHKSQDWAALFLSRMRAQPLLERSSTDEYQLKLASSVERAHEYDWVINLDTSTGTSAARLLHNWRSSHASGHGAAFHFMQRAVALNRETVLIRTRRPMESIRPLLDSHWLWDNMILAENFHVRAISSRAWLLEDGNEPGGRRVVLSTSALSESSGKSCRLLAGVPAWEGPVGDPSILDIEFALMPGTGNRRGPLDEGGLLAVRRLVAEQKLLAPLRSYSQYGVVNHHLDHRSDHTVAYTNFFPNRLVAEIVQSELARAGVSIALEPAAYTEKYEGYSISAEAELVPIVPHSSSCTDIPRQLLASVRYRIPERVCAELVRELDEIETDLEARSAAHRAARIRDAITTASGFGVLGRYRGFFNAPHFQEQELSSAGFTNVERFSHEF